MARLPSRSGNGGRRHLWLSAVIGVGLLVAAPPAQASFPFAYVTGGSGILQYNVGAGGLLAPLSPPTVQTGRDPAGVAVSPNGRSVYVAISREENVSQYDIGADGRLSPKSPLTVAAGDVPRSVAVSPDGRSVYVTSSTLSSTDPDKVFQYDVGAGGRLSPKSPATVANAGANTVAVSPDGHSVYVTNQSFNSVSQYNVGAGGKLSPKSPATVATGGGPTGVAVRPDGQSVYVVNQDNNSVSQYNVGAGGKLSPKSPATVAAGSVPQEVAVSPGGGSLYVTNSSCCISGGQGTVSQYDVGGAGRLSPKSPAKVAAGVFPRDVAVTPDGRSAYVTNYLSGTVSQYNLGAGGKLSPKSPATVAADDSPVHLAVTPPPPGWEGWVTNRASGCRARVQVPYLDGTLRVTAYTQVSCPKATQLTIRSRLRSDYPGFTDKTVARNGCLGGSGCVIAVPKGTRYFRLACPKSGSRQNNQPYYSDIIFYPGTNKSAATTERSRDKSLSPFCAY
jgi:DNA-binding beta-propeller fold protein YncE